MSNDLEKIVDKYGMTKNLLIRGSKSYNAEPTPFWSDIDITFLVDKADYETLKTIEMIKTEYDSLHKDITLSVVVTEKDDFITNNYFHHHGVKPLSYNLELSNSLDIELPDKVNVHLLRESSVYRLYEILHTFRREVVKESNFSSETVAKGFHRVSQYLRNTIEIQYPEFLIDSKKIRERKYINVLEPKDKAQEFFNKYDYVRENWQTIRNDNDEVQVLGEYLVDCFNIFHTNFLPKLKKLGDIYATNNR
jgi:hypothetical protein